MTPRKRSRTEHIETVADAMIDVPPRERDDGRAPSAQPDRRFDAVIFDWDGTAVPDRRADASDVRDVVERLCAAGMDVAVVSGTHVGNVDGQLRSRPTGPGRLHLCVNRGSEVFEVGDDDPRCVYRRVASPEEDAALTAAAELTVGRLAASGLETRIVSSRLNRRKVDLIDEPAWRDPPKARLPELLAAVEQRLRRAGMSGLPDVVGVALAAAAEVGLSGARVTSDAKHVEIGLTDKADSARWIFSELARRGIGPGLVLIAGDEMGSLGGVPGSDSFMLVPEATRATAITVGPEPGEVPPEVLAVGGGPARFVWILNDQLRRRDERSVPRIDEDPAWVLAVDGLDPQLERVHEALLTLADGRVGTSGAPLGSHPSATPSVVVAGVYDGSGPDEHLLQAPVWNQIKTTVEPGVPMRRMLDLRTGVLRQTISTAPRGIEAAAFSSLDRPGTVAMRVTVPSVALLAGPSIRPPDGEHADVGFVDGARWMRVDGSGGNVAAVVGETQRTNEKAQATLERIAAYSAGTDGAAAVETAASSERVAEQLGFESLLVAHRAAWAERWDGADVVIGGDPELQKAVRFALFHLMSSVADVDEAAVGARGLTGPGYRGHVFWDAEVFVLPFLAATHPAAARAMLEYRVRRLPAAKRAAAESGSAGARFPWESAREGRDVTPTMARDQTGRVRPIRNGQHEEHIVADVAWAASCYLDWTGDGAFAAGAGRHILVETARYWASRIRLDVDGRGHLYGVIGPDEYHEVVDDDAFTNVMARWNLRAAARAVVGEGMDATPPEARRWLELADSLVDGYREDIGVYEQFAGFFELEPLIIQEVAPRRPIAADVLLGADRVKGAQVVKQADVLMLHHMVPDEVALGSLSPNLDFYEPRTAHGSSLSPGVHAALLARAGRTDEAIEALRLAAAVDLDDLTGTTATGLHIAAMGSVWQALVYGFAGIRPRAEALHLDPRLPDAWSALDVPVRFRGASIRIHIEPESATLRAGRPVPVMIPGIEAPIAVGTDGVRVRRTGSAWEVDPT